VWGNVPKGAGFVEEVKGQAICKLGDVDKWKGWRGTFSEGCCEKNKKNGKIKENSKKRHGNRVCRPRKRREERP